MGVTPVTCTATDAAANSASAGFTVTVRGVSEQLSALGSSVVGLGGGSFAAEITRVQSALAAGMKNAGCGSLNAFANHVRAQSGRQLTVAQADQILADAARIGAVTGC